MSDNNYGLSWPQTTIDYLIVNYADQPTRMTAAHVGLTTRELAQGIYNLRRAGHNIPFLAKTVKYGSRNMPAKYKPREKKAVTKEKPPRERYKDPYKDNENTFLGRRPVNSDKKTYVRHHFDEETMVRIPHPMAATNPKYKGAMIEVKK